MLAHKTLPRKEKFHCTESFIVHKTYIFIAWIMNFGRRERGDGEERGHKDWKDIALQFVAVNIYWYVMLVSLKRRREHNTKKQPWNERGKCCFCQSSAESSTDPCKSLIVYENPSTSSSIFTRIFRHGICSSHPVIPTSRNECLYCCRWEQTSTDEQTQHRQQPLDCWHGKKKQQQQQKRVRVDVWLFYLTVTKIQIIGLTWKISPAYAGLNFFIVCRWLHLEQTERVVVCCCGTGVICSQASTTKESSEFRDDFLSSPFLISPSPPRSHRSSSTFTTCNQATHLKYILATY